MELKVTTSAQSMLDQLPVSAREQAHAAIENVYQDLKNEVPPQSVMQRIGLGQTGDFYVMRFKPGWRIYLKLSQDRLSVEDVVSEKQLESLRKSQ